VKPLRLILVLALLGSTVVAQSRLSSSEIRHSRPVSRAGFRGPGFSNGSLDGTYVFTAAGRDTFAHVPPAAYEVTGVFTADGNGNITGGEEYYGNQPGSSDGVDAISASGSSYSIGADGRGTLTLNTGDTQIGVNGVETFSFVLSNSSHGLITQFDASATSSGTLDLQNSGAAQTPLSAGYAFVVSGVEQAFTKAPLAMAGVFNVDGAGTISGAGSVMDINDAGTIMNNATLNGTVVNPDGMGKVVINLTVNSNIDLTFLGFIVDATHMQLIERDRSYGTTSGIAFAQGSNTGNFGGNSAFNATVVYSTSGYSSANDNPLLPTAYAGLFTADGAGDITNGYTDENQFGTLISDTLSGSYSADQTGRVTTSGMFYGFSGPGPSWILYLTGASDVPALILQVDGGTNFIVTAGAAYTQSGGPFTAASFSGPYGLNFTAFPASGGEDDGTGQITADGNSAFSGNEDANVCNFDTETGLCSSFTPNPGLGLSGSFSANSNGRFIGSMDDATVFNADPFAFYFADTTRVLIIDLGAQPATGVFELSAAGGPYGDVSPTSLTFNTQAIGTTSPAQPVTLTNTGGTAMSISSIVASHPFSQTNNCGATLNPEQHCTIEVKFTPKAKGLKTGKLTITDNAPNSPQIVKLQGMGTYVQLTPGKLSFGNQKVGTRSKPKVIQLANKGKVTLNITRIGITGADTGDFSQTNNCGKHVVAGGSCKINITFKPALTGPRTANLSVYDDGGGSPQAVPLTGNGT